MTPQRKNAAVGGAGGAAGKRGENAVIRSAGTRVPVGGNAQVTMGVGDIFVLKSPGGGGFGDPI